MGKILGIDYGNVRVGLAMTDSLKITAQSMDTLVINKNVDVLIQKIKKITSQEDIEEIVIGYPRHMSGDISSTAKEIDNIIKRLQKFNIPIIKWDERLTTVMAHKTMKDLGIKQKDKNRHADRLAALYILEDYLNSKKQV